MQFDIQAPDGRIFTLEGDSEPTEQDLNEFYSSFSEKEKESISDISINPSNLKYDDIASNRISVAGKVSDYMQGVLNFSVSKPKEDSKPKESRHTIFEIKKTEEEPEGVKLVKEAYEAFKDMPSKISAPEVAKSTARSLLDLSKSTSEGLMAIADWMQNTEVLPENSFRNATGKVMYKVFDTFKNLSEKGLDSQLLKQSDDIYSGTFAENPSFMRLLDTVMKGSSSFASMYGVGKLMNRPKLALGLMTVGDSSEVYWDAVNKGVSVDKAMGLYSTSMAASASLEKYGMDRIIGDSAGSITKAIISEGGTEMLQQGIAINLVKKLGYDETVNLFEGVLESAIVGGIWGGIGRGVSMAEEGFQNTKEILRKRGYNESESDTIIEGIGKIIGENGKLLDKHINSVIDKNVSLIENKLQQMPIDKQNQFRVETSRVREENISDVGNMFPEWTPEQITSVADYITAQTAGLALIQDVSPMEAREQMAKMERTTEEDFFKALNNPQEVSIPFQKAYVSMRGELQGEYLDADEHYGEGEGGTMAHGWGNYLLKSEAKDRRYLRNFSEGNYVAEYKGEPVDLTSFDEAQGGLYLNDYGTLAKILESEDFNKNNAKSEIRKFFRFYNESLEKAKEELSKAIKARDDFEKNKKEVYDSLEGLSEEQKENTLKASKQSLDEQIKNLENVVESNKYSLEKVKRINEISLKDFDIKHDASIYEVEIPENDQLLDEDLEFYEQPEIVKKAINDIIDNLTHEQLAKVGIDPGELEEDREYLRKALTYEGMGYDINVHADGRGFYKALSKMLGSKKAASKMLEKHGVKGIRYEGLEDGRGFVIFSGKDTSDYKKLDYKEAQYQTERGAKAKGAYIDGKVYLFEGADVSTVQHEYAHAFDAYLTKLNTPESIAMKEAIDEWTQKEFNRKYKVIGSEGKYFVIDTTLGGKITYDNMGNKFKTISDAEDYARKEIFAQGAEKYVSTEEAPSNVLKRAFRAFIEFFKESYSRTKALNIELTPEIKEVYSNMLGGASLDTFLRESLEDFIEERKEAQAQKQETIDDDIQKIEENAEQIQYQGSDFDYLEAEKSMISKERVQASPLTKAFVTLSLRASKISKAFHARLNRYEFNKKQASRERKELLRDFLEKALDIKKNNPSDYAKLKYGMLNDNFELLKELSDKYEMAGDFAKVQEVMDEIYNSLKKLGFNVDYRGNYLPRSVKDYNKFIKATTGGIYSPMEKMIREASKDLGRALTQQERAELINMRLRMQANDDVLKGVNHKKGRTVEYIDEQMAELYEHPVETMVKYVEKMSEAIETAKFLGKNDNVSGSIGEYVSTLVEDGVINASQEDEALNVIRAMLEDNPINSMLLRGIRDWGYLATMGNFSSAITQIDDFSASWDNAGFKKALKAALQKSGKGAEIDTYDLAIDQIGDEFKTSEGVGKAVETIFKTTGLTKIDTFMKNTFINSDLDRMRSMSDKALADEIRPLFDTEAEVNQVVKDIKSGNKTTDTLFVSWHNLSKYQPISRLESPEYSKGNAKLWYALKSFTLKRIDMHLQNLQTANDKSKTVQERRKAALAELRLCAILIMCGASKDAIIDLIYGRKIDLSDTFVNNLWGLWGLNKYFVYKAREEGVGSMIQSTLFSIPILNIYNTLQKDITMYLQKDSQGKKKRELKNWDTFKYMPLLGGFYYWHIGGGKAKQLKKAEEERNKKFKKKTGKRIGSKNTSKRV